MKKPIKRRNRNAFLTVSFDLINSYGKTNLYSKVYNELSNAVGPDNYYRTLKQYCVVRTNIVEQSLVDIVKSVCGEECNVSVFHMTMIPEFSFYDQEYAEDAERLRKDMENDLDL